ncbi:MAG: matrixin family metalloprotease [Ignavibacteriales bacterium]
MKKIILLILISITIFIVGTLNVKAANTPTPTFGHKIIWNIESIYYYVSPGAEQYANYISDAAYNWVYTGLGYNKLYPNARTSNIYYSAVDFYVYQTPPVSGALAQTKFFARTNGTSGDSFRVYPDSSDWLYAEIEIYSDEFNEQGDYNRRGVISHEFGHAWGLAHNSTNPYSIMSQLGQNYRQVNTVQQVDQDAFNSIYR